MGGPPAEIEVLDTGHVAELARLHGERLGIDAMVQRPYPSRVI